MREGSFTSSLATRTRSHTVLPFHFRSPTLDHNAAKPLHYQLSGKKMPPIRRATARKSVAPPRKCSMPNFPAASNDDSWGSELEKALALALADSQPTVSPALGSSSVVSDASGKAPVAPDDLALEAERGEGISEARAEEEVAVAHDDAVSVPSSACSAEMEVSLDEVKVRRVDCGFAESGRDTVVDDGGDQVVVDDNAGKEKKVVKKMVKVVKKKVKMKVLKKVPQVGIRRIVDSVAQNLNPNSIERVEIQPVTSSCVQLNHKNSNSGTRGIETNEKDGLDTQVEQVRGNVLGEVDQKGGGHWFETGNRVVQEHPDDDLDVEEERNEECGDENEELCGGGDKGAEEQGKNEELGNVGRLEEQEEKLVSGELEAMESRKRKTEIFIGGLDEYAKEEDVREIFARAGEIVNLTVVKDAKTGKNKGHAFVRYATVEEAKKALENFSKVKVCGKHCDAIPVEKKNTIFLGSIDKNWKDKDVIKFLQGIGIEKIDKVKVMVESDNSEFNHGFALVELETSVDAKIAYKKLRKEDVAGKNRGINVAWAKPLKEPNEEEILKVNMKVSLATMSKTENPRPAAKLVVKEVPENGPKINYDVAGENLPQDVMRDLSRDEENVRHVKEHDSEVARETVAKAAKMKFHPRCHETLSARTNIAQPSTPCITLVDSIDGSRIEQIIGDKSFFACSSDGKRPSEYNPLPPPPKRNKSTAPTPPISSQTGLGITPLLMVKRKEKVQRVKELYDQWAIPCPSNEPSSEMAGQEDMHARQSAWVVRGGREASTEEAPDAVLSADYSVLSSTAVKARVASLEKQRFDALIRAFKAKEAQTKAEKSKEASQKQLQAKQDEIKALKKKHMDEIKHLQRKHRAALKKAEDWGFKKGKGYQLDLMKEALAFFDAEFRFEDFVLCLEYIENDRKKSMEAAVRQVRLEAEQFASQSKDDKPLDTQNVLQTSLLFGKVVGEEEGVEEEQEEQYEEEE